MQLSERIGGKSCGLLALSALGLPVPRTAIVTQLPQFFPSLGSDRVIIRPSEHGASQHDAVAAQSMSGMFESAVTDAGSWPTWREHYAVHGSPCIAAYVLQPFIEVELGVMGHTSIRQRLSFIAVANSLRTLSEGQEAIFEAVLEHDGKHFFSHSPVVPDDVGRLLALLSTQLPRLLQWSYSDTVEWEAAVRRQQMFFLQAQASTADIPDWTR